MRGDSIGQRVRASLARHGAPRTFFYFALKSLNRVVWVRILKGFHIEDPDPAYLGAPERYRCGFLDEQALAGYCGREDYELPEAFLRSALGKGDECYGILAGGTLAGYGWYSKTATEVTDDLRLHFDPRYIYMYKGFTHPEHRGQRLHAIGMTQALAAYRERGHRGLVTFVEADNFDSLKSVRRMGYRCFGSLFVVRILGRYLSLTTPGCGEYGFGLETAPRARPARGSAPA